MNSSRLRATSLPSLALCLLVAGCAPHRAPRIDVAGPRAACTIEGVHRALARFGQSILRMDAADTAAQFTEAGSIADQGQRPIVGHAAIQAFLESFVKFKVLEYDIKATSTSVQHGRAAQSGSYSQVVVIPDGNTVHVRGSFQAAWECNAEGAWRISTMQTAPAAAKAPG